MTGTHDGTVRIWPVELTEAEGTVEAVIQEIEVLTGMVLTEAGTVNALGAADWAERRGR